MPERAAIGDALIAEARPGDRILIMGARDDTLIDFARDLVERLAETVAPGRWACMAKPGTVTGWKLPRDEREHPARSASRPDMRMSIADHVTLRTGATPATPLPRKPEALGSSAARMTAGAWNAWSSNSTGRRIARTARPITSPGRSGPAARRARATTCCAIKGWEPLPAPARVDAGAGALLMTEPPRLFLDADGVLADFDRGRPATARHDARANSSRSMVAARSGSASPGRRISTGRCRRCPTPGGYSTP